MSSLYIHRTFADITEQRVFAVIRDAKLGYIERIDKVTRIDPQTEAKYLSFFVHLSEDYQNEQAKKVFAKLEAGETHKLQYSKKWHWIIAKSRVEKLSLEDLHKEKKKEEPEVVLDAKPELEVPERVFKFPPADPAGPPTPFLPDLAMPHVCMVYETETKKLFLVCNKDVEGFEQRTEIPQC